VYAADDPINAADPRGSQAYTEYAQIDEKKSEEAAVIERHHLLPRQFREEFRRAGIKNIDDFTVELERDFHKILHGKGGGEAWFNSWNQQWKRFFIEKHYEPSVEEIFSMLDFLKTWFGMP